MSDAAEALNRKIGSAAELQSVVRAMKALAAASIGQYDRSVRALADYYRTVELGLSVCARSEDLRTGSAQAQIPDPAAVGDAVVFGSDQGLVGQFNEVVAAHAIKTLGTLQGRYRIWTIGERVHARLTEDGRSLAGQFAVPNSVQGITPLIGQIQVDCEARRHEREPGPLWVFHNRPLSGSLFEPVGLRLLPLDEQWQRGLAQRHWPSANLPEILGRGTPTLGAFVREYLFISLFRACAESLASENAARLSAMQRAEENIDGLLEDLHRDLNQSRQAGIDEELFDVIAGFEALGGSR